MRCITPRLCGRVGMFTWSRDSPQKMCGWLTLTNATDGSSKEWVIFILQSRALVCVLPVPQVTAQWGWIGRLSGPLVAPWYKRMARRWVLVQLLLRVRRATLRKEEDHVLLRVHNLHRQLDRRITRSEDVGVTLLFKQMRVRFG